MDLHLFAQFYEEHIANQRFEYHTTNQQLPVFAIEARGSQLPHLMGLQKWNNLPTSQAVLQYDAMLNGTWNVSLLQKADMRAWKEYRYRIEFMPYLYTLLYTYECTIKLIHPVMPSSFKNRRIDMIFQKEHAKLIYALELRDVRNNGIYIPVSLTTHTQNSRALQGKHYSLTITRVDVTPI